MTQNFAHRILASMNVQAIAAPKTYEEARALADKLETAYKEASKTMQAFPKGKMGMTPDEVKKSPQWQLAKRKMDDAHHNMRAINEFINKYFKKEYAEDRKNRAANRRPVNAKASNDDAAKILEWLSNSIGRPTKIPQGWTQGGMDGPAMWEEPIQLQGLTIKKACFAFNAGYLSLDFEIEGPHGEDFKFSCEADNAQGLIQRFLSDLKNQVQTSQYRMRDAAEEHKGFTSFLSKLGGAEGQQPQVKQQPEQPQQQEQRAEVAQPRPPHPQDPDRFTQPARPVGQGRQ